MPYPPLLLIKSDLHRFRGRSDFLTGANQFFRSAPFRYQCFLRLRKSPNFIVRAIARLGHRWMSSFHGVEIPVTVEIGEGLLIPHLVSIVVNSTAQIGANCTLSHGVTIGSSEKTAAIVGDRVFIGPHACLVEQVTIGDGAAVGAGAVVVHDVPAGITVAGNPASPISSKGSFRLIKNPWMT